MNPESESKANKIITGWDIGGAHLKMSRVENGVVTAARTLKASMWLGLDEVRSALASLASFNFENTQNVFTMTGELSDGFASRKDGIEHLLNFIGTEFDYANTLIYAGRSGFLNIQNARDVGDDIASANWHATAAITAKQIGMGVFVDMGSTTTDIIAFEDNTLKNQGYSDPERLQTGELVYTGFTRSALIGIAELVPVKGAMTPLMNEYFANTADIGRILGMLDEGDDQHPTPDRREKTMAGSIGRLARMIGLDSYDLSDDEWVNVAQWFSEHQLRMIHNGALRVASKVSDRNAPIVGAGIGRPQIKRLAARMERPYLDFGAIIPAKDDAKNDAAKAAPATAVALLAAGE